MRMFLRSSCSQNFVKVLAHDEHGPVSGRNLFSDNFARGGLPPCHPAPLAFVDGEVHSRDDFGESE